MPLLAAGGAQAAETETWDRVAQCESGGVWSANSGNGYYGGLQLTQSTWEEYGGTGYAESPDLASRSQQIAIAEKILADRGPDAWPSCSVNAGLSQDSAPADIDPSNLLPDDADVTPAPTPESGEADSREQDAGAESGESGNDQKSSGGKDRTETKDGIAPSPQSENGTGAVAPDSDKDSGTDAGGSDKSSAREGASVGERRGAPDAQKRADEAGGSDKDVRASDLGRGGDEDARADRKARSVTPVADYRVESGDSLSRIAAQHDVEGGWPALYQANKKVIGDDPNLIVPGQRLDLR